jgi:O-antigen/teichoic acid export membrane protein
LFLPSVYCMLQDYGIRGWAISLIFQQLVAIIGSWIFLAHNFKEFGWFPRHWSKDAFLRSFRFGMKLQVAALANLLSEPLAKLFLGYYGSLEGVGLYEMAMRLVTSVRSLVVQALQPLVAAFARMSAAEIEFRTYLFSIAKKTALAGGSIFVLLVLVSPLFSRYILGGYDKNFILMIVILAFGSSINIVSVPYYFATLAKDVMKWNILAQFMMALSVVTVSPFLGPLWQDIGVCVAISLGFVSGGLLTIVGNSNALKKLRYGLEKAG